MGNSRYGRSNEGRDHGLELRTLPERPALSLADRGAAHRYRRGDLKPHDLSEAGSEPRSAVSPHQSHKRKQARGRGAALASRRRLRCRISCSGKVYADPVRQRVSENVRSDYQYPPFVPS